MLRMKTLCLGLLLLAPQILFAAQISPASGARLLRNQCSAASQNKMKKCLAAIASDSERNLRQTENDVSQTLQKWDEDPEYVDAAKSAFIKSSRDFSAYKNAQCLFAASLVGGAAGNAHDDMRLACIADLNNKRVAQLENDITDLQAGNR